MALRDQVRPNSADDIPQFLKREAEKPVAESTAVVEISAGKEVAHYDPKKGLKNIAVAEAAEKMFRRAKDSEALFEAVTVKLAEQRQFVLWWDEQEKAGVDVSAVHDTSLRLADFGTDRDTVYRWRKRLANPKKYDIAIQAAQERCRRVCEMEKGSTEQKGASGTGENEWYTPAEHIERAREVLGAIDLDPASSRKAQSVVKAEAFFSVDDDGLTKDWNGRVWLNPPYAQPAIAHFVSKMVEERREGRVSAAIMLTHNYTDTAWFHEAAGVADAICFTRGRVKFYDNHGNVAAPTQGQAFFYFGDDVLAFASAYREIGFVVIPHQGEA